MMLIDSKQDLLHFCSSTAERLAEGYEDIYMCSKSQEAVKVLSKYH